MAPEQLVDRLREAGVAALAAMRSVPDAQLQVTSYEQGWSVGQVMAHVAAMEYAYRRLPDLARRAHAGGDGSIGAFDMDAYNAKQVAKRAAAPRAELEDEFTRGRAALIAELDELDAQLWAVPVRSAGGHAGTLRNIVEFTAIEHVQEHVADFSRAAGAAPSPGERAGAALLLAAAEVRVRVQHAPADAWLRRPDEGEWSAAGITGHLIELMPYWAATLARLAEGPPDVEFGRELNAPERLGAVVNGEAMAPADALALLERTAVETAVSLRQIPAGNWSKPVVHSRYGRASLAELLERLLTRHVREHASQAAAALAGTDG